MKKTLRASVTEKIIEYIKAGKLAAGQRLPPMRKLAAHFGVSMHTVSVAVEQLSYRGVVEIRPQSGVFVAMDAWQSLFPRQFDWDSYFNKSRRPLSDVYHMFSNRPQNTDLSFPCLSPEFRWFDMVWPGMAEAMGKILPSDMNNVTGYGYDPLRKELAVHFMRSGLDVPSRDIIITRGIHYSMLLMIMAFFPADCVCYYPAPSSEDVSEFYNAFHVKRVPVPADSEGMSIEYLASRLNRRNKNILITMPVIQPVTGVTMSMQRRRDLYNFCCRHNVPIVEIDEYRDFHPAPLPPIKWLDKNGIVFYAGTFMKTISRSLGVGWIVPPSLLTERLADVNLFTGQSSDMLQQHVVYELLRSGAYRDYTSELRKMLEQRRPLLDEILRENLGDIATWNINHNDVFLWIRFNDHIDVLKMAAAAVLAFVNYAHYTFAEANSILITPVKFSLVEFRSVTQELSALARKSLR